MNFELLLRKAQAGEKQAIEDVFQIYQPLLVKNSMSHNRFDEDLFQEMSVVMLNCIQKFSI